MDPVYPVTSAARSELIAAVPTPERTSGPWRPATGPHVAAVDLVADDRVFSVRSTPDSDPSAVVTASGGYAVTPPVAVFRSGRDALVGHASAGRR